MVGFGEIWRPVVDWEDLYEVSNFGRVRRDGETLTDRENSRGYLRVKLCRCEKKRSALVHVLVCEAFIGPREKGIQVNHIDGNKKNNCLWNLEYCTHSQNMRHSITSGIRQIKYTDQQLREAVSLVAAGMKVTQASRITGVGRVMLSRIIAGNSRIDLGLANPSLLKKGRRKLNASQEKEIAESNEPTKILAKKFGVSVRTIRDTRYRAETCSAKS